MGSFCDETAGQHCSVICSIQPPEKGVSITSCLTFEPVTTPSGYLTLSDTVSLLDHMSSLFTQIDIFLVTGFLGGFFMKKSPDQHQIIKMCLMAAVFSYLQFWTIRKLFAFIIGSQMFSSLPTKTPELTPTVLVGLCGDLWLFKAACCYTIRLIST